ncbi:MAG: hypothetical protein IIX93_02245, partial [Clostridia bacterium]|nr:hypothetical protein [Clostridia bacterium]
MKKILYVIAFFLLCLICAAGAEEERTVYTSGDYRYTILEDGTVEITEYTGEAQELVIPDELDGYTVSALGDSAFEICDYMTTVTIPDSV